MFRFFKKKSSHKKASKNNTILFPSVLKLPRDKIEKSFYLELEEKLVMADAGLENAQLIAKKMQLAMEETKKEKGANQDMYTILKKKMVEIITDLFPSTTLTLADNKVNVLVMIGVNGVGKTSTIAKLTNFYLKNDYSLQLAACDTFRAAATEQLLAWSKKLNVPLLSGKAGGDSASIAYDAIQSSIAKKKNVCLIDTAGRLENKTHLMDQLQKIKKIIGKFNNQITTHFLLVLDATLGDNGFNQAKIFQEKIQVDGIILTKMDARAKGGILLAIASKLNIPVYFTTHGETMNDIAIFDKTFYANSLLE